MISGISGTRRRRRRRREVVKTLRNIILRPCYVFIVLSRVYKETLSFRVRVRRDQSW